MGWSPERPRLRSATLLVIAALVAGACSGGPAPEGSPFALDEADEPSGSELGSLFDADEDGLGSGLDVPGDEPSELQFDIQTITGFEAFGLAVDGSMIWMTDFDNDVIRSVDGATAEIGADIAVGRGPVGIAVDGDEVWVSNSDAFDHTVMKIDASTGQIEATVEIEAGNSPTGVALTDDYAWVGITNRGDLAQIDRATGTLVAVVAEGPLSGGNLRIDVLATAEVVWTIDRWCGRVLRIDPATAQIVAVFDDLGFESSEPETCEGGVLASGPARLAEFDGGVFVLAEVRSDDGFVRRIYRIDIATDELTTVIDVAVLPTLSKPIGLPSFVVEEGGIWFSMGDRSVRVDRLTGRIDDVVTGPSFSVVALGESNDKIWHAVSATDGQLSGLYGVDAAEVAAAVG